MCLFFPAFAVFSRTLRSVPQDSSYTMPYVEPEEDLIPFVGQAGVETTNANFAVSQKNHTPDFQMVEQPDSETGINSNYSADFPSSGQSLDMKPGAGGVLEALPDGSIDPAAASPVAYEVTGSKDTWIDRNPPSVILQQHHSDEM